MSWFHNMPTNPTFLPPSPREEEITAKDIEACYQWYTNLRWDIHERYYFQEYMIKYVFFYKKENENSLRNNQQCISMEEMEELPIFVGGEAEKALHQEDRKSLPNEFEKYEETSMRMNKRTLKLFNIILKHILLCTWTKGHLQIDA